MQIDWLEGTVHGMTSVILDQLHQYFKDWQETDRGGLGYEVSATVLDSGRVFWSQIRPQMGVYIRLPATALAVPEQPPLQVLCDLKKLDAKSRASIWQPMTRWGCPTSMKSHVNRRTNVRLCASRIQAINIV